MGFLNTSIASCYERDKMRSLLGTSAIKSNAFSGSQPLPDLPQVNLVGALRSSLSEKREDGTG
jgi:hypothetical protein